jgi:predicted transport protein
MALFKIDENEKIKKMEIGQFNNEKELQRLCEKNLEELFQVKFVATEFPFADEYSGRLDTIGLDYKDNPVIIEYKFDKNQAVLSQALFYMDWLVNHKGDFEMAAKAKLGVNTQIKWDNPKMILVAQDYNKYDKYAVNQIGYDIYLYKYIYYKSGSLYLENINVQDNKKYHIKENNGNLDNNGEKYIRKEYDFDYHLSKGNDDVQSLLKILHEKIIGISDQIEIRYPGLYIAYRTTRNFAEVHIFKSKITVYVLKENYDDPEKRLEKVPESYQWAVDQRIDISNIKELDYAFNIIYKSYESTL